MPPPPPPTKDIILKMNIIVPLEFEFASRPQSSIYTITEISPQKSGESWIY